ncbi:hypothetical protein MPSEU_000277500 [Mayamaea pseudoterrestris]|nr:hypothetical protein MPSEU_000277500 [Mayamaea pseudoterrestris]
MSSFRYPNQLLHQMTEPQWLARPRGRSRLDDLETQEAAHLKELSRQVLPEAPVPIGLSTESAEAKLKPFEDALLLAPPIRQPFWITHRDIYEGLKRRECERQHLSQQRTPRSNFAASMSMFSPSAMSLEMSTSTTPSAMDDSRNSIPSYAMASPTGRLG